MANPKKVITLSANEAVKIKTDGEYSVMVKGTWGSGTMTVRGGHDDTTFVAFSTPISKSANFIENIKWAGTLEFNLTGATNPSLSITVIKIN